MTFNKDTSGMLFKCFLLLICSSEMVFGEKKGELLAIEKEVPKLIDSPDTCFKYCFFISVDLNLELIDNLNDKSINAYKDNYEEVKQCSKCESEGPLLFFSRKTMKSCFAELYQPNTTVGKEIKEYASRAGECLFREYSETCEDFTSFVNCTKHNLPPCSKHVEKFFQPVLDICFAKGTATTATGTFMIFGVLLLLLAFD